jgi:hypothetical protein
MYLILYLLILYRITKIFGAFLFLKTIKTAPFFCVCPVYILYDTVFDIKTTTILISIHIFTGYVQL